MAICCPKTFTGFCLDDQTPIAITIDNGVLISWTNLVTGVITPGNPPAGTGVCEVPSTITIEIPPVEIAPLTCVKDAVTVCQGTTPWEVTGNIVVEPSNLDCLTDSVTVCQGTDPWTVDGTVELGAITLAALETITVNQGTSPWIVSGTVVVSNFPASVEISNDVGNPIPVNGTVALDAPTLAALESITVQNPGGAGAVNIQDGGNSITVDGAVTVSNFPSSSPLTCETDSITVCPPVSGTFEVSDPNVPDLTGIWGYVAGISGTEIIVGRVISITAVATGLTGGSMVIDGGDTITLPSGIPISIAPGAQLINPTITFTDTASYFVEFLT